MDRVTVSTCVTRADEPPFLPNGGEESHLQGQVERRNESFCAMTGRGRESKQVT